MFERLTAKGFHIEVLHHAEAILKHDMGDAVTELEETLLQIQIPVIDLIRGGGGEGVMTQNLRRLFSSTYGWKKHIFIVQRIVDGERKEAISHEIDHVKRFLGGTIALEIEWNNKDPFFDRDLENFKRLHSEGAISIGSIVTRGASLQDSLYSFIYDYAIKHEINNIEKLFDYYNPTKRQIENILRSANTRGSFEEGWAHTFVSDKFGQATTHWRKLEDRVRRGVGNPCPLLLIGIPKDVVIP